MKRVVKIAAATLTMTILSTGAVLASGWQKDSKGWWYSTNADNSAWHANGWQWVDGNGDGTAECYYFDSNGYCLMNTTTPDGYKVNENGAWLVNGAVQTKKTGTNAKAFKIDDYVGNYKALKDVLVYSHPELGTTVSERDVSGYSMKVTKSSADTLNFKIELGGEWGSVFKAKFDANGVGTIMYIDENASIEFFAVSASIDTSTGKIHIVTCGAGDGEWTDTFEFVKK